jgi:hypothetical protein
VGTWFERERKLPGGRDQDKILRIKKVGVSDTGSEHNIMNTLKEESRGNIYFYWFLQQNNSTPSSTYINHNMPLHDTKYQDDAPNKLR